jgi:ubiquinone/menaquinone biosynthesis C-methylase UbiE
MAVLRKPFQGVLNIVRFNWHFYVLATAFLCGLLFAAGYISADFRFYTLILFALAFGTTLVSLLVSFYVYDVSNLYQFDWLESNQTNSKIVNINAGFDETSVLLKDKFPQAELTVLDFYDPAKHTEVSIKRARKAYPPFPNTQHITTSNLRLTDNFADKIFIILAAHEIRNANERAVFFNELHRVLKPNGQIFVVEHLRDKANFGAYNIGFLHFLSLKSWYKTFQSANLNIKTEQKITSFITLFTLEKHDIAA